MMMMMTMKRNVSCYLLIAFIHLIIYHFVVGQENAQAKVIKASMTKSMSDDAVKLAESSLLKISNIEQALDQVAETFKQSYAGNWYCFRSGKFILKSKLVKDSDSYALMSVPPIDVLLISLPGSGSGGGSSPDSISSAEMGSSEQDMIKQTRDVIESEAVKIFQNNLPKNQKEEAIYSAKWAINNVNTFGEIEQTMKDTMESRFGSQWRCFVMCYDSGLSSSTGAGLIDPRNSNTEPIIYFGVGRVKMVLYKPIVSKEVATVVQPTNRQSVTRPVVIVSEPPSEFDVIQKARLNINRVEVNSTELNTQMQQAVLLVVKEGIQSYDSYDGISKFCRDSFDASFGKSWSCLVGLDRQFWVWTWYRRPFFMNFKIDKIRVLVLKQLG